MFNKDIVRSHVLENSLFAAGHAGRTRGKKGVRKGRFLTPVKGVTEKSDGTKVAFGRWHAGNRHNNHHK